MSVMNGFREDLLEKILGRYWPCDQPPEYRAAHGIGPDVSDRIAKVAGMQADVRRRRRTSRWPRQVRPIRLEWWCAASGDRLGVVLDRQYPASTARSTVSIVGAGVAIGGGSPINWGCASGDKVTLVAPQRRGDAIGTMPRMKATRWRPCSRLARRNTIRTSVFMPLNEAQAFSTARAM